MMLHRRLLLGGLASMPMVRTAEGAAVRRLTILHMNDLHSRHEPVDGRALSCRADLAREGCFGGVARLASALAAERAAAAAQGRSVLLLDAGDQFQGSLFYTAWKGEVELAVMHALGTEAMAVGNHEFDSGPANLARFAGAARFPVLSANVDASAEPDLAGKLQPHVMIEKDGFKIGVVGLTTLEAVSGSMPGPLVRFNPPGPALAASAAVLRAQGAQIVIALSHLGVGVDRALAGRVSGVDVFVGGHSHTLLSDSETGAMGPAHQVMTGEAGSAVVVQAGCFGRYFGRLDLDLDAAGGVVGVGGDVRHVGLDWPEEPRVAGIVAGYAVQLDGVRKRVIGTVAGPIDNAACRVGECPLGNFIADAMMGAVHGADLAIMNAGGIRTGLPGGTITMGDVLTMLPFSNTVATVTLTGADVMAALANGVARAGAGGFPQLGGARMAWNAGARTVEAVEVRQADGSFARLDPGRRYTVATNNFLRAGGDGYTVMRDRGVDAYDAGPSMEDSVMAAFGRGMVPGAMEGRITRR